MGPEALLVVFAVIAAATDSTIDPSGVPVDRVSPLAHGLRGAAREESSGAASRPDDNDDDDDDGPPQPHSGPDDNGDDDDDGPPQPHSGPDDNDDDDDDGPPQPHSGRGGDDGGVSDDDDDDFDDPFPRSTVARKDDSLGGESRVAAHDLDDKSPAMAAKCSADDEAKFVKLGGGNSFGTVPKIMADCGLEAWSPHGFDIGVMQKCVVGEIGVSSDCASCYVDFGMTAFQNCVLKCLNWCAQDCLDCTADAGGQQLKECLGFDPPAARRCDR